MHRLRGGGTDAGSAHRAPPGAAPHLRLRHEFPPGEWIAESLERCGYPPGTCVFTSADLGLGKHTGRMFPAIAEALGCRPADIVHIGDNPVSDLANAEAAGFRTVHLPCALPRPERERIAAQEPALAFAQPPPIASGAVGAAGPGRAGPAPLRSCC